MHFPVYIATAIEKSNMLGGSTQPSIMTVQNEEGKYIGRYVTKVFKQKNTEQYQPTNKEVYCHILAQEFELKTPDIALIYVGDKLIQELKNDIKYVEFQKELKAGYYFGSVYLPNVTPFKQGVSEKLLDISDIENIFAFDVLIRNMDRNTHKPNLIIYKKSIPILIDHEIALDIRKTFKEYRALGLWKVFLKKHIFQEYLSQKHQKEIFLFEEFLEYLRHLDLNKLYNARELLYEHGHAVVDFDPIIEYLNEVKRDIPKFKELLMSLIK